MNKLEEKKDILKKLHKKLLMYKNIETYNYITENRVKVNLYFYEKISWTTEHQPPKWNSPKIWQK